MFEGRKGRRTGNDRPGRRDNRNQRDGRLRLGKPVARQTKENGHPQKNGSARQDDSLLGQGHRHLHRFLVLAPGEQLPHQFIGHALSGRLIIGVNQLEIY